MFKKPFYFHLLLLVFFGSVNLNFSNAATITWVGTSGDWHVNSNWDSNSVPQSGDDVIISANGFTVGIPFGIKAFANTLQVEAGTIFLIEAGASLQLEGASANIAFANRGASYIYGDLQISHVSNGGTGIMNTDVFYVGSGGRLDLIDIDDVSIFNDHNFYNFGTIDIREAVGHGIENNNNFYNYLNVLITLNTGNQNFNIYNKGRLYNYSDGDITLQSGTDNVFNSVGSFLYNYGELNVFAEVNGIINEGYCFNFSDAFILIDGMTGNGFSNLSNTINSGVIEVGNDGWIGVLNHASFINYGNIYSGESDYASLYNLGAGSLRNHGEIALEDADVPLSNYAQFHNLSEAVLKLTGGVSSAHGGMLTNDGLISAEIIGPSLVIYGDEITNNGAIETKNGTGILATAINNQIVFNMIYGVVEDGIPKTNVFDVNGWNNVDVLGVFTDYDGNTYAGSYDITTNTLTVNSEAIGLTTLFFEILIDGNYQYMIQVALFNPVQAVNAPQVQNRSQQQVTADLQIYPNPSSGFINVRSEILNTGLANMILIDLQGQIVYELTVEQNNGLKYSITRPIEFRKLHFTN